MYFIRSYKTSNVSFQKKWIKQRLFLEVFSLWWYITHDTKCTCYPFHEFMFPYLVSCFGEGDFWAAWPTREPSRRRRFGYGHQWHRSWRCTSPWPAAASSLTGSWSWPESGYWSMSGHRLGRGDAVNLGFRYGASIWFEMIVFFFFTSS